MAKQFKMTSKPANEMSLVSNGPGKVMSKVRPRPAGGNFQGGANSFSPKGMSTYKNSRQIGGSKGKR